MNHPAALFHTDTTQRALHLSVPPESSSGLVIPDESSSFCLTSNGHTQTTPKSLILQSHANCVTAIILQETFCSEEPLPDFSEDSYIVTSWFFLPWPRHILVTFVLIGLCSDEGGIPLLGKPSS